MAKDARLTLRITDELDAWLGREADLRGLDKAAFARMALFERMNGASVPVAAVPVSELVEAEPQDDGGAPSVETLLETARAHAGDRGAAAYAPVRAPDMDPALQEFGMRAFQTPPPPHFGDKSPRIQRYSTWTGGAR